MHRIVLSVESGGESGATISRPAGRPAGTGSHSTCQPRERASEVEDATTLKEAVAALEKRMIVSALERAHGNRSEAARQLGIGRPQLYAKMEEYGLGDKS